ARLVSASRWPAPPKPWITTRLFSSSSTPMTGSLRSSFVVGARRVLSCGVLSWFSELLWLF
ncbi:MAG: hypothetical protein O2895_05090, partial [Chloroflexi bacterium]|nr:hypothetical protein [Chloroflexota bacterium]